MLGYMCESTEKELMALFEKHKRNLLLALDNAEYELGVYVDSRSFQFNFLDDYRIILRPQPGKIGVSISRRDTIDGTYKTVDPKIPVSEEFKKRYEKRLDKILSVAKKYTDL